MSIKFVSALQVKTLSLTYQWQHCTKHCKR